MDALVMIQTREREPVLVPSLMAQEECQDVSLICRRDAADT